MNHYAQDTSVSVDRSKQEIERTLQRYGATEFVTGWKVDKAMIQFRMNERVIRFVLVLPEQSEFSQSPAGRERKETQRFAAWEQACRQRWRALALCIKAKLESSASGIEEFDTAFMGQVVMPDGHTVSETVLPQITEAYASGKMPMLKLKY